MLIFIISLDVLHFGMLIPTRISAIVVELFPIQDLAADCPILIIFKHSRLTIFHIYVVVYKALRVFQQFKGIHYNLSYYNGLIKV